MKQARHKIPRHKLQAQRQQKRLKRQLLLIKKARRYLEQRHKQKPTGCLHEWVHEGQTPTGNIATCIKCGILHFG